MTRQQRKSKQARGRALEVVPSPAVGAPRLVGRSSFTWISALVVFLVTWFVFQPALDGQWLSWDDDQLLLEREEWRGFGARNLGWMFTTFHMGPYQPLSWLSYALDHALHGLDPRGYHRTNLILHASSATCLFLLARELFAFARTTCTREDARGSVGLELAAVFTALAWSIHPLRVESVAWITERRDCLSGLFLACGSLAWLRHVRGDGRRGRAYWLAVVCFAASLLSKGLGLGFPLVLLALDVWPLRRFARAPGIGRGRRLAELVLEKAPFLALSCAAGVVAILGQRAAGAMVRGEVHDLPARIVQSFYGLAHYVWKTVWPVDLMALVPMRVPLDVGEPRFVLAITAVVLGAFLFVVMRRRAPAAAVAFASYALFVFPVLGLVQTGSHLVADRYSYLATIPLVLCAGGGLLLVLQRLLERVGRARRDVAVNLVWLVVLCAVCTPLAFATARQSRVWHDTVSLWQHDLAVDPTSAPARRNLMAAFEHAGRASADPVQRREHFERALALCRELERSAPDAGCFAQAAKVHDILAAEDPTRRAEHLAAALDYAKRSVDIVERTLQRLPEAYEGAGVVLAELGRAAEAVPYLERLVALDPGNPDRQGLLGEVLMQAGRGEDALVPLRKARELAPESTTILLDLGDVYRGLSRQAEAVEAYERVLSVQRARLGVRAAADPDHATAERALRELGRSP